MKVIIALSLLALLGSLARDQGDSHAARANQRPCVVGKRAALDVPRVAPGEELIGLVQVLGCRDLIGIGIVEVVGFETTHDACSSVDYVDLQASEPLGCFAKSSRRNSLCDSDTVCALPVGWLYTDAGTFSHVNGLVRPQVSRVNLLFSRGSIHRRTFLIRVPKKLLRRLQFPIRFSAFISAFPGCPGSGPVSARAFDTRGELLDSAPVPNLLPSQCQQDG
jgi:hypothetical protein